ncbi:hypothetical protein BASA81_001905 [Batrachochytrium salamandrivorans]|nr:hypothetical protein BASA81_001905 [Batrachochytrium salamandrivorans]
MLLLAGLMVALVGAAKYRHTTKFPSHCRLVGMYVYPVKGLQGYAVTSARLLERGLEHDRRFMIVDSVKANSFCTQREYADMARIECRIVCNSEGEDVLELRRGERSIQISQWTLAEKARVKVRVWSSHCEQAVDQGQLVADWLAGELPSESAEFRLVYMPDECERQCDSSGGVDSQVSFADGYPYLIANTESLEDLNQKIVQAGGEAVPMERFRPNLVVSGLPAWSEDRVGATLQLTNGTKLQIVSLCDRCKVTTIDQSTGRISPQGEPLQTLKTFRRVQYNTKVFFAINAVRISGGSVGEVTNQPVELQWK